MVSKREAKLEIRLVVYKWFCSLEKKEVKFIGFQKGNPQFCFGKNVLLCSNFRTKILKK